MGKIIQRPGIAERLVDFFRLTGSVQLELEEFVQPNVIVGDLSQAGTPPKRRHASAQFAQGAVVAEFFQARLEAPPGVLLDIKRLSFSASAVRVFVGFDRSFAPPPATPIIPQFTDGRLRDVAAVPSAALLIGTGGAGLAPAWSIMVDRTILLETEFYPKGWLIGVGETTDPVTGSGIPFSTLEFSADVVNVGMRMAIEWDEYLLT